MNIDQTLSQILYVFAGFCFGIFASRYSVISWRFVKKNAIFNSVPALIFMVAAFLIFPLWLSTHTLVGSFVYYAVLVFFFGKGYNK